MLAMAGLNIGRLVRGTLKPRLILGHWDDMLRVAGSLKLGWVTASLFIAKYYQKPRLSDYPAL
jgi:TnpA family transposase